MIIIWGRIEIRIVIVFLENTYFKQTKREKMEALTIPLPKIQMT